MKCKEHEHNFIAERYTEQKSTNVYQSNHRYQTARLNIEKVLLFCTKCGLRLYDSAKQEEIE